MIYMYHVEQLITLLNRGATLFDVCIYSWEVTMGPQIPLNAAYFQGENAISKFMIRRVT